MHIVANTCAVRSGIIIAKDFNFGHLAERHLQHIRNDMRLRLMVLNHVELRHFAGSIEQWAAAAAAGAIGVPPEVQAPAKKKTKLPLIIALIVVVLGVAGYFIYQNLPSTRVSKFKKQAVK